MSMPKERTCLGNLLRLLEWSGCEELGLTLAYVLLTGYLEQSGAHVYEIELRQNKTKHM